MSELRTRDLLEESEPENYLMSQFNYTGTCTFPTGNNTPTTIYKSGTHVVEHRDAVMTDVVTPNFESLVHKGFIVNNPMTRVETKKADSICQTGTYYSHKWLSCTPQKWLYYVNNVWGTRPSSDLLPESDYLPVPEYDSIDLINEVVTEAWSKVTLSETEALVQLMEAEKTLVSLVSIYKRLFKIVRNLKNANVLGLAQELSPKQLADRWMEARYALRPLLCDIEGTIKAFQKAVSGNPQRNTFRASDTFTSVDVDSRVLTNTWTSSAGTWTRYATRDRMSSRNVTVRAGVLTELDNPHITDLFGVRQPIEAIWEIVPFSFVIDWFFNVGQTIASWTPNYGLRTLASWYVVEDVKYQSATLHSPGTTLPAGTPNYQAVQNRYELSDVAVSKQVTTKVRIPNPQRSVLPSFKLKLNTFKLVDLAIMLKNMIR